MSKVKHKQQRLSQLLHASKCQHKDGTCPEIPYCSILKKLWKHVVRCKNNKCSVEHCKESRYILTNHQNSNFQFCVPARKDVKRKYLKYQSTNNLQVRSAGAGLDETQLSRLKRIKHAIYSKEDSLYEYQLTI